MQKITTKLEKKMSEQREGRGSRKQGGSRKEGREETLGLGRHAFSLLAHE